MKAFVVMDDIFSYQQHIEIFDFLALESYMETNVH